MHRDVLPIQRSLDSPGLLYESGTGVMPVVVVLPLKFVDKRLRKKKKKSGMIHASSKHICAYRPISELQDQSIPSFFVLVSHQKTFGFMTFDMSRPHQPHAFQEYSLFDYWDAWIANRPGLKWSFGFNSFPRSNQESMKNQVGALEPWTFIISIQLQLWPFTSYNWLFLWEYTFYKWGYKYL